MTGPEIYDMLKADGRLLFYALRGSFLYGTNIETSDHDYHGVFMVPNREWLSLFPPQDKLADPKEDTVFFELKKYVGMAMTNNPTVIEMMWTPEDAIVDTSPIIQELFRHRSLFVTKRCFYSFSGYAFDQIKKAKGKNKKVHGNERYFSEGGIERLRSLLKADKISPEWVEVRFSKHFLSFLLKDDQVAPTSNTRWKEMDPFLAEEDIASLLPPKKIDFVHIVRDKVRPVRPVPMSEVPNFDLRHMNCSSMEHIGHQYRLYDYGCKAKGVFHGGDIVCASIPIEDEYDHFYGLMIFAHNEYESEKKAWHSYWEWMANRNEARWKHTDTDETFEFDRKNMLHTFRLIFSGENVARYGCPRIRFPADTIKFLRAIRAGEYEYDYLLPMAEEKLNELRELFEASSLPEAVDTKSVNELYLQLTDMQRG